MCKVFNINDLRLREAFRIIMRRMRSRIPNSRRSEIPSAGRSAAADILDKAGSRSSLYGALRTREGDIPSICEACSSRESCEAFLQRGIPVRILGRGSRSVGSEKMGESSRSTLIFSEFSTSATVFPSRSVPFLGSARDRGEVVDDLLGLGV